MENNKKTAIQKIKHMLIMQNIRDEVSKFFSLVRFIIVIFLFTMCKTQDKNSNKRGINSNELVKLEYNNPGILVDLDVGFKSVPMPMDFDGDGDLDLLISESGSYAESGVYYFENISRKVEKPIFRYGMRVSSDRFRLGSDGKLFATSHINGSVHVLTPDKENKSLLIYKDVPQNVFWNKQTLPISARGHIPNTGYNTWKIVDLNGDSINDLICGLKSKSGSFLLFFKNIGSEDNPKYESPIKITTIDGQPLGKNLFLEVALADYDNDGDLDYIGTSQYANFIYFENVGTSKEYKFTLGQVLKNRDEFIQMESHYGGAIKPRDIDFNADGFIDIIVGDEDGKVSFLKNTGRIIEGIPEFEQPIFFQQEAKFVDFGALTAPRIFDWDNDGIDDIISGNGAGHIGFIRKESDSELKFAAPQLLKVDGETIRILPNEAFWGYTTIDVGYWNEDDLPDILVNHHDGNVLWYENVGSKSSPKLKTAKPIEVQWRGKPQKPEWGYGKSIGNELLAQWRTSPLIMDFNEDGLSDLVMLDYEGYLSVYLRFKEDDKLLLAHPERRFRFPNGEPILLNQLKNGSMGRLKISFADWDGDGLDDLIFSSKPAVDWMKNLGMKDGMLTLQYMGRILSKTLMGHTDGPVVTDWNGDGIPDLLVGTETGVFYYWERSNFDITTTMTTDRKQKPANYKYFKR